MLFPMTFAFEIGLPSENIKLEVKIHLCILKTYGPYPNRNINSYSDSTEANAD